MPAATTHRNAPSSSAPVARTLGLIGAPCDVAAGTRGANLGPEALRVAGVDTALTRMGYAVHDHGNVAGPANPSRPAVDGWRHFEETLAWCRGVRDAVATSLDRDETLAWCRAVRDAVATALDREETPILMGGDAVDRIGRRRGASLRPPRDTAVGALARCARRLQHP